MIDVGATHTDRAVRPLQWPFQLGGGKKGAGDEKTPLLNADGAGASKGSWGLSCGNPFSGCFSACSGCSFFHNSYAVFAFFALPGGVRPDALYASERAFLAAARRGRIPYGSRSSGVTRRAFASALRSFAYAAASASELQPLLEVRRARARALVRGRVLSLARRRSLPARLRRALGNTSGRTTAC